VIVQATQYPYQGVQQACKSGPDTIGLGANGPKSTGYHNVIPQCKNNHCDDQFKHELDLMLHVKGQGPFIAYVDARKWQHYANGVYPDDKCSHAFEDGNHVVQLLGYGRSDGVAYWLVKNS